MRAEHNCTGMSLHYQFRRTTAYGNAEAAPLRGWEMIAVRTDKIDDPGAICANYRVNLVVRTCHNCLRRLLVNALFEDVPVAVPIRLKDDRLTIRSPVELYVVTIVESKAA